MAIKVKTCVGNQTFENKDGKQGFKVFYTEEFDSFDRGGFGQKVGELFTYEKVTMPQPGEKFKAYYDAATYLKDGKQQMVPRLVEIQIVKS